MLIGLSRRSQRRQRNGSKEDKDESAAGQKFVLTVDLVYLHIFQKLEENPADDPEELYKRASLVSRTEPERG